MGVPDYSPKSIEEETCRKLDEMRATSSARVASQGGGTQPVSTNPKAKFGATKPDLSLIPQVGLLHCAMAMEDGARKYQPYNWRDQPVDARTYVAAAMRHLGNWLDGEELTSDTSVHNLGAVMACCAILLDNIELGILVDNRPKAGRSSEVQERLRLQKVEEAAKRSLDDAKK